jgi:hypothetical protein
MASAQSDALFRAGEQAIEARDRERYAPSRVLELLAERVASNPAVLALPPDSLVTAAVRLMECDASCDVAWRLYDRSHRYSAGGTAPPPASAQPEEAQPLRRERLGIEDVTQRVFTAFAPLDPLAAALRALRTRAAAGLLRATPPELWFFNGEGRLGPSALLKKQRASDVERDAGVNVALDLGARAMECRQLLAIVAGAAPVAPAVIISPLPLPETISDDATLNAAFQSQFRVAAEAVHLALRCAMEEDGAPGSYGAARHAHFIIHYWMKVQRGAARCAALRNSPSFASVRAMLTEGGAAMEFLRVAAAAFPADDAARAPTLRRCAAPGCAEAEVSAGQFKKWARCGVTHYCCKTCQVAHWKAGHKRECGAGAA